jgi:hypothetical protein
MNFDTQVDNAYKKDDTFSRTMGQKLETPFCTFNETYGKFSEAENKYKKTGIKEKIFEDFFKAYVNNEQAEKSKLDESIKNIRLYDSTTKNLNVSQPADFGSLGSRHMITQDNIPVNKEKIDKLFMANHEMSKYPNILSDAQAGGYVDKYIPYYKDKEITYWSMNLDKGNMWRSHTLGENAFARSSGFTQPIHNSKAVNQYLGNVTNSSSSKNIYLGQKDYEFIDKYNMSNLQNSTPTDLLPQITEKIMNACKSKGWLGLRNLRIFLYGCVKRCTEFIDKSNFKYFFTNFGIVFLEKEVEFIFAKFDHKRNNSINFNEFLDTFTICCDNRTNLIKTFFEQIKNKTNDFASFKKLEKIGNFDNHPEVNFVLIIRYSIQTKLLLMLNMNILFHGIISNWMI